MCCLSPDSAGGELILGWRKSALFFKSPLSERLQDASSDFWKTLLADSRQPRISSPPAEADQTASPARAVRFSAVGLGWLGGRFVWSGRLSGFPVGDGASALRWMLGAKG